MQNKTKTINIDGKKHQIYSLETVLKKHLKNKDVRKAYDEEITRLKLAYKIRQLRLRKHLTQKQVAIKAKMPQSVIARLEGGEHSFSLGTLSRVASVFGKELELV